MLRKAEEHSRAILQVKCPRHETYACVLIIQLDRMYYMEWQTFALLQRMCIRTHNN